MQNRHSMADYMQKALDQQLATNYDNKASSTSLRGLRPDYMIIGEIELLERMQNRHSMIEGTHAQVIQLSPPPLATSADILAFIREYPASTEEEQDVLDSLEYFIEHP